MRNLSIKYKSNGMFFILFVVIFLAGVMIYYSLEKARKNIEILNMLSRQRTLAQEMAHSVFDFSLAKSQRKTFEEQIQSFDLYITKMREVYMESVIKSSQNAGLKISMDPDSETHSAIPFSATFTRMVNDGLGDTGIFSAEIISEDPINPNQTLKSELDKEANVFLKKSPGRVFSKIVEEEGRSLIKFYRADRAAVPACASCHSALQNKKVKVGDILGVRSYSLAYSKDIYLGKEALNATLDQYESARKAFKQTLDVVKSGKKSRLDSFEKNLTNTQMTLDPRTQDKMMEIERILYELKSSIDSFIPLESDSLVYQKSRNKVISASNALGNKSEELVFIYQSIAKTNHKNILLTVISSGLLVVFALISMAFYMTALIIKPVQNISLILTEITSGKLQHRSLKVNSKDEIGVLSASCNELLEGLKRYIRYLENILAGKTIHTFNVDGYFKDSLKKLSAQAAAKKRAERALREAQIDLETRVKKRTTELFESNESLKEEILQRKEMEVQLNHAQKMESIGQLAAGIAHEINTPMQFIGDNTRFMEGSFKQILHTIKDYERLLNESKSGAISKQTIQEMEASIQDNDIDYIAVEIPLALRQSLDGVNRVSSIVKAMKEFSHPGSKDKIPTDINKAIKTTLVVAKNEWKYVADIVEEFDPGLPLVPSFVDDFNQVILNTVVNAAHAIGEKVTDSGKKGTITIKTRQIEGWVEIRVQDTGMGIPEKIKSKVFDPFFTTKDVGKGTGQGLSIVHTVITQKHQGTIDIETEEGIGTTFIFKIPL